MENIDPVFFTAISGFIVTILTEITKKTGMRAEIIVIIFCLFFAFAMSFIEESTLIEWGTYFLSILGTASGFYMFYKEFLKIKEKKNIIKKCDEFGCRIKENKKLLQKKAQK